MFRLLLVTTLALIISVSARAELIPLPYCGNAFVQARYIPLTTQQLAMRGVRMAQAIRDPITAEYLILFDYQLLENASPSYQLSVFMHECAHHKFGHTPFPMRPISVEVRRQQEKDADCFSMEAVKDSGATTAQLDEIYQSIYQFMTKYNSVTNGRTAYSSPLWTAQERVAHAKQCLQ